MPSKRKKNKRRMRRVQAQRRALEEQYAANLPIKASSGIAVSAPPTATPKKAAKAAPPTQEKLPPSVPISVPLVAPPKEEPEPVVKEDAAEAVQVEAAPAESDAVLLDQASVALEVESRVGDEVEGPARVSEEAPVESSPPVEPSTVEGDLAQEAEAAVSETEPVSEVVALNEDPAEVAAEAEIQAEDNEVIQRETDKTHGVHEVDSETAVALPEGDTETKVEVEAAVTEQVGISESGKEAAEEPDVEDLTCDQYPADLEPAAGKTETNTGSEVEDVTETLEPEKEAEKVSPADDAAEDGEEKPEDLADEDPTAPSAESVTAAEDALASSVEIPAVLNTITEAPADEADPNPDKATEETADLLVHESVATESVTAVKDIVSASAVAEQETEGTGDMFTTLTASREATPADPATAAAPTGESAAADLTSLDALADEAKPGGCDIPCQVQLPVEVVQLGAAELSVEITQNGNIVSEVSIEG
ncbi:fibrous sheath CABYR-binding protein isoform X2 [Fundulus heteroclitus]|uniref:fibrous sheath CABYR-binding protein isoform X2 n=1 Tax=Fundulus heteroclitus TaxID=8078 RepID=UPI00165AC78E|nr:fibrous sheath CABYR-binding protein isoform X2 [Fundulus heteroclitus]